MRLYECHNVGCERANGEQIGVARFGSAMATCFDGYSTEARVAREGFDRLPGVAAEAVLKNHRQSGAPCVLHVEDRRSFPRKLSFDRGHEMKPTLANVRRKNSRASATSFSSRPCIMRGPTKPLCLAQRR